MVLTAFVRSIQCVWKHRGVNVTEALGKAHDDEDKTWQQKTTSLQYTLVCVYVSFVGKQELLNQPWECMNLSSEMLVRKYKYSPKYSSLYIPDGSEPTVMKNVVWIFLMIKSVYSYNHQAVK